jgi:hypothetical protein
MARKLKALGLVLIGAMAVVALVAAVGWAEEEEQGMGKPKRFKVKSAPAILTGEEGETTTRFITPGAEVACFGAHFQGTVANAEEKELTITPAYKECEGDGFPTHFEFNGCDYLFTNEKGRTDTGGGEGTHTAGPVQIKCPAGKSITAKVTVFGSVFCTITIPAQTPKKPKFDMKNLTEGPKLEVLFTSTVKEIHYEVTGGGGTCGETGKTLTNGELVSAIKMTAYKDEGGKKGEQVGFQIYGDEAP